MHLRVSLLIVAALAATAWSIAHADEVYRWVDQDGYVHYSQTPPAATGVNARKVDITPLAPDPVSPQYQSDLAQFVQQKNTDEQAAEKQAAQDEQKKARIHKACDARRAQLQLLRQSGRVFTVDAQGERKYIADPDRAQQEQQLQDEIGEYCSGDGA